MPGLTFLNAIFLAGIAAASLPILIHLFSRRRAKRLEWSSNRFLRQINRQRIRRVKLRQLLLLAMRVLAIVLFATAMGRPALTGIVPAGGRAPSTACLVLDTSYSMAASRHGEPGFDIARKRALDVLDLLGADDEAYLITVADQAESFTPYAVQDLGLIREHLAGLESSARAGEMRQGLALAARLLQSSKNLNREIYVVSDLQRTAWRTAADSAGGLGLPPNAAICVVGLGDDRIENLAVDDARADRDPISGRGVVVEAVVSNHGIRDQKGLSVTAYVGDRRAGEVLADVPANGTVRVRIDLGNGPWPDAWGSVRIPEDALAIDDIRYFLLGDQGPVRVAVVADRGEAGGESTAAEFLRLALEPVPGEGPFQVRTIDAGALGGSDLRDYGVVILAGPSRIESDGVERLKAFVRDGGGLLIFPGERSDLRLYSDRVLPSLLPIRLAGLVEADAAKGAAFRLTPAVSGHSIFLGFRASPGERLTHASFHKVVKVVPGGARVLAQFRGDLPAMVEGRGVVFFASSVDRAWNDLPTSGAFVPLLHQTVRYLVRSSAESWSSLAGGRLERLIPAPVRPSSYRVLDAGGGALPVEAVERGSSLLLRTPEIEKPGIYRFVDESGNAVAVGAVNPDTRESDLAQSDRAEIERMFGKQPFAFISGDHEVKARVREIRQGRELWRPVLVAALIVLIIEVLLSRGKGAFTPSTS